MGCRIECPEVEVDCGSEYLKTALATAANLAFRDSLAQPVWTPPDPGNQPPMQAVKIGKKAV